ncbi:MAG: F0F1 ATP synthase subunit A, partial [Lewinella sp.]|nr:F0F1 ATP synthase subunit A [Lewinella sp.]
MKGISRYASLLVFLLVFAGMQTLNAQDEHGHDEHAATEAHAADGHGSGECCLAGAHGEDGEYDPVGTVMNHIADQNEFHVWHNVHIPLPCILYSPDRGWSFFLSSAFHHGTKAVDGYVLNHGRVNRVADPGFPQDEVSIQCIAPETRMVDGKEKDVYFVCYNNNAYQLDAPSTLDGGMLGGGITSFYDFSITRNVFTMILGSIVLIFLFMAVARGYKKNEGRAPSGIQSFMEPFFTFMRDEVTRPMIGEKHYERFQPFILTLFFFVLVCNLFGLIPFFPFGAN